MIRAPRSPAYKIVAMGASAGALETFYALLPELPAGYSLPIVIVVHTPPDKDSIMAELLQTKTLLQVREAEDKDILKPGAIYLAPPNYHLLAEVDGSLSLSSDEQVNYSRPSIDVLFESVAEAYGAQAVGVVLSGANNDGARGLEAIAGAGGAALVQQPSQAYAAMMPMSALAACHDARPMSLPQIGEFLRKAAQS